MPNKEHLPAKLNLQLAMELPVHDERMESAMGTSGEDNRRGNGNLKSVLATDPYAYADENFNPKMDENVRAGPVIDGKENINPRQATGMPIPPHRNVLSSLSREPLRSIHFHPENNANEKNADASTQENVQRKKQQNAVKKQFSLPAKSLR
eukprot:768467-Hanusia_phi.AAC.1